MKNTTVLSVSEFLENVKKVFSKEPSFSHVAILGEISNFRAHRSGHFYFSIKDEKATLSVVMFRSRALSVKFKPKDGDKVVVFGDLVVYEGFGQMQLNATRLNLDGLGDLFIQFEALKKDLQQKGLFDDTHKKSLPLYPKSVAVITGKDSAAYADISKTLRQRWPLAQQVDYFSYVQGDLAINDLVDNIIKADENQHDVIILARGGGSIEDLWAFNELKVVLAVFESKTPIVSGIGHESDVTLVDFVSDKRAATPTAAAVLVTPDIIEIKTRLRDYKNNFYTKTVKLLQKETFRYSLIMSNPFFKDPISILDMSYYRLDAYKNKLINSSRRFEVLKYDLFKHITHWQTQLKTSMKLSQDFISNYKQASHQKLKNQLQIKQSTFINKNTKFEQNHVFFLNKINQSQDKISHLKTSIIKDIETLVFLKKMGFSDILNSMSHLSPFSIMNRGYGLISVDNKVINSALNLNINSRFKVEMKDGIILAKVEERIKK